MASRAKPIINIVQKRKRKKDCMETDVFIQLRNLQRNTKATSVLNTQNNGDTLRTNLIRNSIKNPFHNYILDHYKNTTSLPYNKTKLYCLPVSEGKKQTAEHL